MWQVCIEGKRRVNYARSFVSLQIIQDSLVNSRVDPERTQFAACGMLEMQLPVQANGKNVCS